MKNNRKIGGEPLAPPKIGRVIEAFAVNPLDQMMRSGSLPAAVILPRLGVEGTGIVDAVGPEVAGPAIGAQPPFGIGAAIGAGGNPFLAQSIVKATRMAIDSARELD